MALLDTMRAFEPLCDLQISCPLVLQRLLMRMATLQPRHLQQLTCRLKLPPPCMIAGRACANGSWVAALPSGTKSLRRPSFR